MDQTGRAGIHNTDRLTLGHQSCNGQRRLQAKPSRRAHAGRDAAVPQRPAQAIDWLADKNVVPRQVGNAHGALLEGTFGRQTHGRQFANRQIQERGTLRTRKNDCQFRTLRFNFLEGDSRELAVQRDRARSGAGEFGDRTRQEGRAQDGRGDHAQDGRLRGRLHPARKIAEAAELLHQGFGLLAEDPSLRRRLESTGDALEERIADLALHRQQCMRDGGLRDVQRPRGSGHGTRDHQRIQDLDLTQSHVVGIPLVLVASIAPPKRSSCA